MPEFPRFLAHAKTLASLPKAAGKEIAFIGRSNVGKSSLINTLLGRKIARTSSTPGRTQGLCFYACSSTLVFVDFPGFGYAKVSKSTQAVWSEMIEAYYRTRFLLVGTVWIYDIRRDPDELDRQTLNWLQSSSHPFILVLNKSDHFKGPKALERQRKIVESLGITSQLTLLFSSHLKMGSHELWKKIKAWI